MAIVPEGVGKHVAEWAVLAISLIRLVFMIFEQEIILSPCAGYLLHPPILDGVTILNVT